MNTTVLCPHTFSLGSRNCQVLPLVTRRLLPHFLKSIHKIYLHSTQLYGVLKNGKKGGGIIQISQNEKHFWSHRKLSAVRGNLTLHYPFLLLLKKTFLFPAVWASREYTWALILPYPHRQRRKIMMNTFRYVRPKYLYYAQNTQCAQNSICQKGKHIFPNLLIHF